MRKNNKHSSPIYKFLTTHRYKKLVCLIVVLVVILAGLVSGWLPYAAALARCGKKPIITSNFAAGDWYDRPSDPGYGPGPLADHYLCTEQEAIDLGYHGLNGSLDDKQNIQRQLNAKAAAVFAPDKISFTAYTPNYLPSGYTKDAPRIEDIHGKQVLQYLEINDKPAILIRQGDKNSSYAACSLDSCVAEGRDSRNDIIYRSYSPNSGTTFWGIVLQNSFINIETNSGFDLSVSEVVRMFSSLQELK